MSETQAPHLRNSNCKLQEGWHRCLMGVKIFFAQASPAQGTHFSQIMKIKAGVGYLIPVPFGHTCGKRRAVVSTFFTPNTRIPGSDFFTVQGSLTVTIPLGQLPSGQQDTGGPRKSQKMRTLESLRSCAN